MIICNKCILVFISGQCLNHQIFNHQMGQFVGNFFSQSSDNPSDLSGQPSDFYEYPRIANQIMEMLGLQEEHDRTTIRSELVDNFAKGNTRK